jgi:hypothetical protein
MVLGIEFQKIEVLGRRSCTACEWKGKENPKVAHLYILGCAVQAVL